MKIKKILSKESWDRFPYFGFGIIGGIQVFNGLLLIILGIVDVLLHYQKDLVPWPNEDKWNLHRTLTAIDVSTWCGVWFMVNGSIAGCIGRGRRIIKALKFTKGVFLFMSLVSALLIAPLCGAVSGYIVLLRHERDYDYTELLIPVSITFLSVVQIFFACLSVGICCCCSDTKSSKGQRIVKEEIIETVPDKVEDEKIVGSTDDTNTIKSATKAEEVNAATSAIREIVVVPALAERVVSQIRPKDVKSYEENLTSCQPQDSHGCCQQINHCSYGRSHLCNHNFQQPPMSAAPNIIPIIQYPPNYPVMSQSQPQPFLMPFPFQYPQIQENNYKMSNLGQSNGRDTESNVQKSIMQRESRSSEVVEKRSVKLQVPPEIEIKDDDTKRSTKQLQTNPRKLQMSNILTNTYYEAVTENTDNFVSPKVTPADDKFQSKIDTRKQDRDSQFDASSESEDHDDIISTSQVHGEVPESHHDEGVQPRRDNVDRSYGIQPETPMRSRAVERLIPQEAKSGVKEKLVRTHDDFDAKSLTSEYSNDSYNTLKRLALPN